MPVVRPTRLGPSTAGPPPTCPLFLGEPQDRHHLIGAAGLSDDFQHCYTAVAVAGKKTETIAAYLVLTVVTMLLG